MRLKILAALTVAVLATLVFASVALAGSGTTDAIIKDAADGTIDGNWTAAQIQAALAFIKNNPTYLQYSDVEGVLADYLASLPSPGAQSAGGLKFTGGALLALYGIGASLMGGGVLLLAGGGLRRRRAPA